MPSAGVAAGEAGRTGGGAGGRSGRITLGWRGCTGAGSTPLDRDIAVLDDDIAACLEAIPAAQCVTAVGGPIPRSRRGREGAAALPASVSVGMVPSTDSIG